MLLPRGERPTPGLLIPTRGTVRLRERGQRISFQSPTEGFEMASSCHGQIGVFTIHHS